MLLLSPFIIVSISTEFQFNSIPIHISNYFYFFNLCVYMVWMCLCVNTGTWVSQCVWKSEDNLGCQSSPSTLIETVSCSLLLCTQCLLACEHLVILFLPPFCCRSTRIVQKHHHAWLYMGPGIQIQVLIFIGQAFPQWIISQVPIILKYN